MPSSAVAVMAHNVFVGDEVHAVYSLDGEFYPAVITAISESKFKAKAPVQVSFIGYGDSEWKAISDLMLLKLKSKAKGKAKGEGNAKAEKCIDLSIRSKAQHNKVRKRFLQDGEKNNVETKEDGAEGQKGTVYEVPSVQDGCIFRPESKHPPCKVVAVSGKKGRVFEVRHWSNVPCDAQRCSYRRYGRECQFRCITNGDMRQGNIKEVFAGNYDQCVNFIKEQETQLSQAADARRSETWDHNQHLISGARSSGWN